MTVLAHRSKIERFAKALVCEHPYLDVDDVLGEAWLAAVESSERWDRHSVSFSYYLHRRLHWLGIALVDRHIKRSNAEKGYGRLMPQHTTMDVGSQPLMSAMESLTKKERRLLNLMVCPPSEFVQRECCRGSKISSHNYAKHLDCNEQTVWWYTSRIKHALNEVL